MHDPVRSCWYLWWWYSFRERQKVKQEAVMQELQDLKDRCAWLEAQLAAQGLPSTI